MSNSSQFSLLGQKRFLPFFIVQFLGAFNDNVYKTALVLIFTFFVTQGDANVLVNVASGLFILPFFLFSGFAGQIADKYEKASLIKKVKIAEIVIMSVAFFGFYFKSQAILLCVIFLMGAQSSLFGPVKYGYLPARLSLSELVAGNALVELGTFLAILLGTIIAGFLVTEDSFMLAAMGVITFAVIGYIASLYIPTGKAADPKLKLQWNLWKATKDNLKTLPENRVIFLSILGISWFWFFGSVFLIQIPKFVEDILMGNQYVVTWMLTMFSVGIGLGSMLCEKLSGKRVEIGLVPLGAIGLAIFGFDLFLVGHNWVASGLVNWKEFLMVQGSWRLSFDLVMIGVFGGLYIVPLYALVQERSDKAKVSRTIAGNNIINALFMVLASLLGIFILGYLKMGIPELFLIVVILHIIVCVYIFSVVPEFIMRLFAWVLVSLIYRVRHEGLHNIPEEGPAVVVANHISFVDPLIIGSRIRRPVRFVMYYKIYEAPLMKWLFKAAKTIPIAGEKENPELKAKAFADIKQALADGDVVCIFPEGGLTPDGEIQNFRPGIEYILKDSPVPVIPLAIHNLWGSMFSRHDKKAHQRRPRKLWARVDLKMGEAVAPEQASKEYLQQQVTELKAQAAEKNHNKHLSEKKAEPSE
ncbi:MFS transporter [Marinicella sp. W31]|uniref:MFS transporter n=1 Tax=Marinicella sp. W31 TaxID=3023713 RepID=UPI0037578CD1